MSGFSSEWLTLREPLDEASRDPGIVPRLGELRRGSEPPRIVDLAAGTGANLRYLGPRLGGIQQWLVVDRDAALLADMPRRMVAWGSARGISVTESDEVLVIRGPGFECRARRLVLDLAEEPGTLDLKGCRLVTASALLDLVSESWLSVLGERCREAGATVLFALTYDGRIQCCPAHRGDTRVRELVSRHQLTDKGFGRALGPNAPAVAEVMFQGLGYRVCQARSDWRIVPQHTALQAAVVDGWAAAAAEVAPGEAERLRAWADFRHVRIARARSWLEVGHRDMLGWLP
jgi:hypothetical protein